jgi:hypothetical protein
VLSYDLPKVHQGFLDAWDRDRQNLLAPYLQGQLSFVASLLPAQAVSMTAAETVSILRGRLGSRLDDAIECADTECPPEELPPSIQSPVLGQPDGSWLKTSNMVGINVRTVGSFWNVVKYAITLPACQDSIHLLPVWEPGVVGSLYGISSWQINREFYSQEWAAAFPSLDTSDKQLKATVNLLHALGKTVGMDVIPHTDRFSEIVLANPHYFEWLQRSDAEIVDHAENLHREVQARILDFLCQYGPAVPGEHVPESREDLFSEACPEDRRLRLLFGRPQDQAARWDRRNRLVSYLHSYGYEPVPATMAPPFRGLRVDVDTRYVDSQGNVWYDYQITAPQPMSRVFGPLARYKLYGRIDDNRHWEIDFDAPRQEVWDYVCDKYCQVQRRYNFDFMRGDMSHVQMRPAGVPALIDEHYDILRAVKQRIQHEAGVRHFGYFAETFLAPRNIMVYGDEVDHLEASDADTTLGDLQSTRVGSPAFLQRLRLYYDLRRTRTFAPTFAVMTGDKDDPRFDEFYMQGNALRLFIALFLTDMPSYMALGFETRDIHHHRAPNEHYTKLYVFQEQQGPKATVGPYVWGKNGALFHDVTRLRLCAEKVLPEIRGRPTRWLIAPDPTAEGKHLAWTQADGEPTYVFVANTDGEKGIDNVNLPSIPQAGSGTWLEFLFSTTEQVCEADRILQLGYKAYKITRLEPGEGRLYRVRPAEPDTASSSMALGATPDRTACHCEKRAPSASGWKRSGAISTVDTSTPPRAVTRHRGERETKES